YRSEEFNFEPDYVYVNGLNAGGAPSLPIAGLFHVFEGFTELRLPLMDEKPGAYRLSLDAGYRYSSYTLGFNTNTYKIGLEWAPIQAVRFRGGYNRAVRAPNLDELYAPPAVGAGGVADPCWGPSPVLTPAPRLATGVPVANYGSLRTNSAAQINTQTSGNPHLPSRPCASAAATTARFVPRIWTSCTRLRRWVPVAWRTHAGVPRPF